MAKDFIVECEDGDLLGIEVKAGHNVSSGSSGFCLCF